MPFYYNINQGEKRIAEGLLRLKEALNDKQTGIPQRTISDTLLLATWNIREFDSNKYGLRTKEPLYYIAEIISRFDMVAVQEIREDLTALQRLLHILGSQWKYLMTDITVGTQGNGERMAYLYDSRKITFTGLAAEVVIPPVKKRGEELVPAQQLARTPYLAGFQTGWFKFMLCTVHILYGEAKASNPEREKEIDEVAKFLATLVADTYSPAPNMIMLGDFNIFDPTDVTMEMIRKNGFTVPDAIASLPSNIAKNKHYDQIAFIAPSVQGQLQDLHAGVFSVFDCVYRAEDQEEYAQEMGENYAGKSTAAAKTRYYNDWRTHQISDHLPMWVELKIDFGREYLQMKTDMT